MSTPEASDVLNAPGSLPEAAEVELPRIDVDDVDSALGDDSSNYTETLRSSLLESTKENGRGYHKYRDGRYVLPEDEREQERLDMQHDMFLRTMSHKLILAPTDNEILEALDVGTGTGIWAIDYADQHPETNVLGVDLSPIQPTYLPPNCKFEVDDFDNQWTFAQKFDLIHGRMLLTCSTDYPKFFQQAFDYLNPGGWIEMQDCSMPLQCVDDTMTGTAFEQWNDNMVEAVKRIGRDPSSTTRYKDYMIETGFENVEEHIFKWPVGTWPKDKKLKEIGAWNLVNTLDGLEGFSTRLFNKVLGMSMPEVECLLVDVRKELKSKKLHVVWPIHVVFGKKPVK